MNFYVSLFLDIILWNIFELINILNYFCLEMQFPSKKIQIFIKKNILNEQNQDLKIILIFSQFWKDQFLRDN